MIGDDLDGNELFSSTKTAVIESSACFAGDLVRNCSKDVKEKDRRAYSKDYWGKLSNRFIEIAWDKMCVVAIVGCVVRESGCWWRSALRYIRRGANYSQSSVEKTGGLSPTC